MKNIFGIAISIICIVLVSILAGVFINVNLQVQAAREFYDASVERIQASHYSQYAISECQANASDVGYTLEVKKMSIYEDINDYYVILTYQTEVPLLNTKSTGAVEGYAR